MSFQKRMASARKGLGSASLFSPSNGLNSLEFLKAYAVAQFGLKVLPLGNLFHHHIIVNGKLELEVADLNCDLAECLWRLR